MVKCDNCERDLNVDPVDKPEVDWVKVVCSECGEVKDISMIRLSATTSRK
ncbi:MAG: hypothetical protein H8Z69_00555 [Nanohaloarchaea archaeon]|nr:hypothetical protein [Candidatus Nanohaloarchaea archaeon]